jgi:NTP pyrophosphatase (non-canonical NTP hydrolase)
MTSNEWNRVLLYVPERDPDAIADRRVMFHELIVAFADVSEQAVAAELRHRNKTMLLGLSDSCDQLIAAVIDLLRDIGRTPAGTRTMIAAEQERVNERHGAPAVRDERWTDFVMILAEELGEVAEAFQTDATLGLDVVAEELVQVASVALTIRRVAVHRSGVTW